MAAFLGLVATTDVLNLDIPQSPIDDTVMIMYCPCKCLYIFIIYGIAQYRLLIRGEQRPIRV